jgi:hypothetical protein
MPIQQPDMSRIAHFVKNVQGELFNRIQHEQEGEMDLDAYTEKMCDIIHEEIDEAVQTEYLGDVEDVLRDYGFHKALCLYINEFGASALEHISQENGHYSRCLLYMVTKDLLTYSFKEYQDYCEENPL